jgi:hypothetical protein
MLEISRYFQQLAEGKGGGMARQGFDGPDNGLVIDSRGYHTHDVDLRACRQALRRRQTEEAGLDTMAGLARRSETSRSSVSRFWAGGPLTLSLTRRIVTALGIELEEVASPAEHVERASDAPPAAPARGWASTLPGRQGTAAVTCQGYQQPVTSGFRERRPDGTYRVLCYACGRQE